MYDLRAAAASASSPETLTRVLESGAGVQELAHYARVVREVRARTQLPSAYPGSPLIAAAMLRAQDRAVFVELTREECSALAQVLPSGIRARTECADGFAAVRALLPPPERRGLILIDPPYEDGSRDFARAQEAVAEILRRFATAVVALWYPIKDRRDLQPWLTALGALATRPGLLSELWLHPTDSRVALNGSGLLILNPPFGIAERMGEWLPALQQLLDPEGAGGTRIAPLQSAA